jgi:hypothetical protein
MHNQASGCGDSGELQEFAPLPWRSQEARHQHIRATPPPPHLQQESGQAWGPSLGRQSHSVGDPLHFGTDPDADPRIRTSDKQIRIREAQKHTDPVSEHRYIYIILQR